MNKLNVQQLNMHSEQKLMLDALSALKEKTAIRGKMTRLSAGAPGRNEADGAIDLVHDNGTGTWLVACKSSIDRKSHIDQVRRQLEAIGTPGLLVAPYISKTLAEYCRETGLQFIDTHGNAYLRAPGLFVFITGEKSERGQASIRAPKGLTNAAGLRVVFGLLCRPELLTASYKDIARQTGVSLGTAYNALDDLERRGYLMRGGGSAHRKLLETRRLMDEWAINYPDTLRTRLHLRRFSAPDAHWWEDIDLSGFAPAWGSEVAARKMIRHLKPATQTLYVPANEMDGVVKALVKQCRLKPDDDGDIELLEKFWHWEPGAMPDVAPPLLVYSELLAIMDPRAQETAQLIRERYIDTTFDQA